MFRSHADIERPSASSKAPKQHNLYKYKCDFCTQGWESETEVHIHRNREHHDEIRKLINQEKAVCLVRQWISEVRREQVLCLICLTKHPDRHSLLEHINTDHLLSSEDARRVEREIYICDYCCQIFFNKAMLVVHQVHMHKTRRGRARVQCPRCARSLRADTMWSHFQYHQIQSVSCCPVCLDKCLDREDLRKHMNTHSRHYYCDSCMYQATKASTFHEHLESHQDMPRTGKRICTDKYCEKFFVPRIHESWRYQKMSAFKGLTMPSSIRICVLCREICVGRKEMRTHVLNHGRQKQEERRKYTCACGEEFFNRILLKQHTFKLKETHKAID